MKNVFVEFLSVYKRRITGWVLEFEKQEMVKIKKSINTLNVKYSISE